MTCSTKLVRKKITLTTGGSQAIPLTPASPEEKICSYFVVNGTETLTSNFDLSAKDNVSKFRYLNILWDAAVTTSGNSVIILGQTIPESMLSAGRFIVEAWFNGSDWVVSPIPIGVDGSIGSEALASKSVITEKLDDNAVTLDKMHELATGNVIFGNASNKPTSLSVGDSEIVVGDSSTGLVSVAVSGDATLAKTGALAIANSAVTTAKIDDGAVTTVKLDDGAVTASKLDSNLNKAQITIPISFEDASELGVLEFKMCFDCTVDAIHGTVAKPFVSIGTHIFKDDTGTVLTGSQIDMSSALTLGNIVSVTPTANNTFSAGDVIKIETSTSGADGGKSVINLCCTKL